MAATVDPRRRAAYRPEGRVSPSLALQLGARTAGVKTVVMTHFSPTVDPKDDYKRYVDGARKFFSGSILLVKDLMQF